MSSQPEILLQLSARDPLEILEDLVRTRKERQRPESPYSPSVTLYLAAGQTIQGCPIDIGDGRDRSGRMLAMLVIRAVNSPNDEVFYVKMDSIRGVTVHQAGALVDVLSSGILDVVSDKPPPTVLDFKRKMQAYSQALTELLKREMSFSVEWSGIPHDHSSLWGLQYLMEDCIAAIREIATDPMGAEELGKRVDEINITQGIEREVSLVGRTLRVKADLGRGKAGRFNTDELVKLIEKML